MTEFSISISVDQEDITLDGHASNDRLVQEVKSLLNNQPNRDGILTAMRFFAPK